MKKAITMSAIYNLGQGNVANILFEDKNLMKAFLTGSDKEYMNPETAKLLRKYLTWISDEGLQKGMQKIKNDEGFPKVI